MVSFLETLFFSAVMGMSIYLSLPIVLRRSTSQTKTRFLNAIAIGILVFLMGDVFSDASPLLYNGSFYGYGSSLFYDVVFTFSLAAGFLILFYFGSRSKAGLTPMRLSLLIALGIGFQNLTEGLVFGADGVVLGLTGATLVVLVGFTFQNITEGFPIASPFLGLASWRTSAILGLFLIGGLPTVIGGALGFYYSSTIFDLIFDGIAIGSILYVILPMFKVLFRETDLRRQNIAYIGIFIGFALGFIVNLI